MQQCSQSLKGSRGKDANGCKWLTEGYKVSFNSLLFDFNSTSTKDACPITNKKDTEVEIDFKFLVPKLPNAVSDTKFRYVDDYMWVFVVLILYRILGTEEEVDGRGCEGILNPGFPDPIETTSDLDMICFKYPTIFTR